MDISQNLAHMKISFEHISILLMVLVEFILQPVYDYVAQNGVRFIHYFIYLYLLQKIQTEQQLFFDILFLHSIVESSY